MNQLKIYNFTIVILFVLLLTYFLQGVLYSQGSFISKIALALILLISGLFFLKLFFQKVKKNKFFVIWTFLLILNIVGYLFFTPEFSGYYFSRFKDTLFNLILFYPFFYLSMIGVLRKKHLSWFFVCFLPIAVIQYFYHTIYVVETYSIVEDQVINNMAYLFVNMFPYVFLIKKNKVVSISFMFLLMYFIIQGAKRGAIIVGGVGLVLFIYYQLKSLKGRNKIIGFGISGIGIILLFRAAYSQIMKNEYVLNRFELASSGSLSGREVIYWNIWNTWFNSSEYLNLLFGYGFAASLRLSGTGHFAHSDWLEMLSNFGLLGVLAYFSLFYVSIKSIFLSGWNSDKKILIIAVILIWLLISIASMALYGGGSFLLVIFFGYLFGSKSYKLE